MVFSLEMVLVCLFVIRALFLCKGMQPMTV